MPGLLEVQVHPGHKTDVMWGTTPSHSRPVCHTIVVETGVEEAGHGGEDDA